MPEARPPAPEKFWIIWSPTGRTPPAARHSSLAAAENEARRLAALAPDNEFFVLEAITRVIKVDILVERLATEIPF